MPGDLLSAAQNKKIYIRSRGSQADVTDAPIRSGASWRRLQLLVDGSGNTLDRKC